MDIIEILGKTIHVLDQANVPTDLRGAAFGKVFDALVGQGRVPRVPSQPLSAPDHSYPSELHGVTPGGADPIPRLAAKLGLDEMSLREVYEWENGDLRLIVASGNLAESRATGAQQIALLVTTARQLSGLDTEWTAAEVVRKTAQDYGKFDSANFAATVKAMGDDFAIKGTGSQRSLKITRRGIDHAKRLLVELTGASDSAH